MKQELFGHELHLCAAGVSHAGGVGSLVVEGRNLVNAHDNLIDLAAVALVELAHLCRLHFPELWFSCYVVAEQVTLGESVEACAGKLHRANWKDVFRYITAGVLKVRHG